MKIESKIRDDVLAKRDILLHPIRCRIVETVAGRTLTAGQIAGAMPDVAQTTLYRHLKLLVASRYLVVVSERQVRGTVEKLYGLGQRSTFISEKEASALTPDEWVGICKFFAGSILGDFSRYMRQDGVEPMKDLVRFNKLALDLAPEECVEFLKSFGELIKGSLDKPADSGRRRYTLGFSFMPVGRVGAEGGLDNE